jgi:hypothetical protein
VIVIRNINHKSPYTCIQIVRKCIKRIWKRNEEIEVGCPTKLKEEILKIFSIQFETVFITFSLRNAKDTNRRYCLFLYGYETWSV